MSGKRLVRARPTVEPHAVAVLAGDHAETVVLDLVQPQLAGRRLLRSMSHACSSGPPKHTPLSEPARRRRARLERKTSQRGHVTRAAGDIVNPPSTVPPVPLRGSVDETERNRWVNGDDGI